MRQPYAPERTNEELAEQILLTAGRMMEIFRCQNPSATPDEYSSLIDPLREAASRLSIGVQR